MGSLFRILLILDELVHLGSHMSGIFGRNLAQNNIRHLIVTHNFGIEIIGNFVILDEIREQIAVTHNHHKSQVMRIVEIGDVILDCSIRISHLFQSHHGSRITVSDFPIHVGLHSINKLCRCDD